MECKIRSALESALRISCGTSHDPELSTRRYSGGTEPRAGSVFQTEPDRNLCINSSVVRSRTAVAAIRIGTGIASSTRFTGGARRTSPTRRASSATLAAAVAARRGTAVRLGAACRAATTTASTSTTRAGGGEDDVIVAARNVEGAAERCHHEHQRTKGRTLSHRYLSLLSAHAAEGSTKFTATELSSHT